MATHPAKLSDNQLSKIKSEIDSIKTVRLAQDDIFKRDGHPSDLIIARLDLAADKAQ